MTASQQFCRIWRNRSGKYNTQILYIGGADHIDQRCLFGKIVSQSFYRTSHFCSSHQYRFSHIRIDQDHFLSSFCHGNCQIHGHTAFSFIWCTACYCDHFFIFSTKLEIGTERLIGFCSAVVHLLHFNFYIFHSFLSPFMFFRTFFLLFIRL